MKKKESIHEKAIRLLEGGIVDVDGHSVKMSKEPYELGPCAGCNMDCLCLSDTEMQLVCRECDMISQDNCILELVTLSDILP